MKSRGGLGREVRFPLSPLPLPRFYFFALLFTSQPSPLSERLGQAILKICQGIKFPCICVKFYFKLFTFQTHVHVTDVNHWLQGLHEWFGYRLCLVKPIRDFRVGASSLRFPLMVLHLFAWYHHKMSRRRESPRREFTPVVVPVSCKRETTTRFGVKSVCR